MRSAKNMTCDSAANLMMQALDTLDPNGFAQSGEAVVLGDFKPQMASSSIRYTICIYIEHREAGLPNISESSNSLGRHT